MLPEEMYEDMSIALIRDQRNIKKGVVGKALGLRKHSGNVVMLLDTGGTIDVPVKDLIGIVGGTDYEIKKHR